MEGKREMRATMQTKDQISEVEKAKPIEMPLATISEVFSFAETPKTKLYIALGLFFSMIAGLALPASIFYFARIMGEISAVEEEGFDPVLGIVYAMMITGVVALISETLESKWEKKARDVNRYNLYPCKSQTTHFVLSRLFHCRWLSGNGCQ